MKSDFALFNYSSPNSLLYANNKRKKKEQNKKNPQPISNHHQHSLACTFESEVTVNDPSKLTGAQGIDPRQTLSMIGVFILY